MKSLKYTFEDIKKEVILLPISDCHIGASNWNEHKLRETIDYIKDTENAFAILNGDILDMCIPDSVASADTMNDETLSPATALGLACKLFEPIKDKILLVTEGNHEYRQTKMTSISPLMQFCTFLNITDRYIPDGAVIFIRFRQRGSKNVNGNFRTFSIYVTHGTSNSSAVGGKIKKLQDLANIVDCDCYIVGHTHLPACFKQNYFRTSVEKCAVMEETRLFVNSSAYLNYGGYGQRKGYTPSTISQPKIYLQLVRKNSGKKLDITRKEMNCIL